MHYAFPKPDGLPGTKPPRPRRGLSDGFKFLYSLLWVLGVFVLTVVSYPLLLFMEVAKNWGVHPPYPNHELDWVLGGWSLVVLGLLIAGLRFIISRPGPPANSAV